MHELASLKQQQDSVAGWHVWVTSAWSSELHQNKQNNWHTFESITWSCQERRVRLEIWHMEFRGCLVHDVVLWATILRRQHHCLVQFNCLQIAQADYPILKSFHWLCQMHAAQEEREKTSHNRFDWLLFRKTNPTVAQPCYGANWTRPSKLHWL